MDGTERIQTKQNNADSTKKARLPKIKRLAKHFKLGLKSIWNDFHDPEQIKLRKDGVTAYHHNQDLFYDYIGMFKKENIKKKVANMDEEFKEEVEAQEEPEEYLEVEEPELTERKPTLGSVNGWDCCLGNI